MSEQNNQDSLNFPAIETYYNDIAFNYDQWRFGNSYGKYIDYQERDILSNWLRDLKDKKILDLGCGTGRFLDLATTGLDMSNNMLEIARSKHPNKQIIMGSATEIPLDSGSYNGIFSFHLFMHLDQETIKRVLKECYRILDNGGVLIFDIPSKLRRKLVGYKAKNWHIATSLSMNEIRIMCGEKWQLVDFKGVAIFPIHRIPGAIRSVFLPVDELLCKTLIKILASYYLVKLRKI